VCQNKRKKSVEKTMNYIKEASATMGQLLKFPQRRTLKKDVMDSAFEDIEQRMSSPKNAKDFNNAVLDAKSLLSRIGSDVYYDRLVVAYRDGRRNMNAKINPEPVGWFTEFAG
jgi:hypothetical protein